MKLTQAEEGRMRVLMAFRDLESNDDFKTILEAVEGELAVLRDNLTKQPDPVMIYRAQGGAIALSTIVNDARNWRDTLGKLRDKAERP